MKYFKVLVWVRFTTSKVVHDVWYKKHCIRVAKRLKIKYYRKLGNTGKISTMSGGRA